ncbi:aldehyde dehydrogenase family protein [Cupriavidus necator]|uniref:aldehyde dehydrogenase family protein n=1 Tax=Cupriavidus necator TaxID=106590 RepID=UPI0039C4CAEB
MPAPADVVAAVAAANQIFREVWRDTPGVRRAELMLKLGALIEGQADRMSRIESTDNGKIARETRPQMLWVGRQLRYFAGHADKLFGQHVPLAANQSFTIAKSSESPLFFAAPADPVPLPGRALFAGLGPRRRVRPARCWLYTMAW